MSKKQKPVTVQWFARHLSGMWDEEKWSKDGDRLLAPNRREEVVALALRGARFVLRSKKATKAQKEDARDLERSCLAEQPDLHSILIGVVAIAGLLPDRQRTNAMQSRRGNGLTAAVKLAVKEKGKGDYEWTDIVHWIRDHDWDRDKEWQERYPGTLFRFSKYTANRVYYETHKGEAEDVGVKKFQEYIREAPKPR